MVKWKSLAGKIFEKLGSGSKDEGLFVETSDLLSLKKKTAYLKGVQTKYTSGSRVGDIKSAFKGRGIEMEESRAYIFGDDIRDIDWRISARKQQPYTKIYKEERDREVMILLDMTSSMIFGTKKELKSVTGAKVAAILGWIALEHKDRVGVGIATNNDMIGFKPSNQTKVFASVCKKIASTSKLILNDDSGDKNTLLKALQWADLNLKSKSVVFIISDFARFDADLQRKIGVLARKSHLYMLQISDILEEKAPKSGEYMIENEGKQFVFDSSSKEFKKKYQEYFASKRLKIKKFCNKFNGKYLNIINNNPLVEQLKI